MRAGASPSHMRGTLACTAQFFHASSSQPRSSLPILLHVHAILTATPSVLLQPFTKACRAG